MCWSPAMLQITGRSSYISLRFNEGEVDKTASFHTVTQTFVADLLSCFAVSGTHAQKTTMISRLLVAIGAYKDHFVSSWESQTKQFSLVKK